MQKKTKMDTDMHSHDATDKENLLVHDISNFAEGRQIL